MNGVFLEYWNALDRAAHDSEISLEQLRKLVDKAYPEPW